MKIQVIKKGTVNAKPSNFCDILVDDVPLNDKQNRWPIGTNNQPHAARFRALGVLSWLGRADWHGPVSPRPGPRLPSPTTTLRVGVGRACQAGASGWVCAKSSATCLSKGS